MAAANNEFFEALSMLEHERGITAEYLIEKIKAAIMLQHGESFKKFIVSCCHFSGSSYDLLSM